MGNLVRADDRDHSVNLQWVRIGFAGYEEDALPLFFNRATGDMTYSTPSDFVSLEDDVRNMLFG